MQGIKVLIITTGHHIYDGRLVRHKRSLQEAGIDVSIEKIDTGSRLSRFLLGPFLAYKRVINSKADCVIFPDPELHLFLTPFVKRRTRVICDVHEHYEDVIYDRNWIKPLMRPLVSGVLRVLSGVRNRFSDAVLVADFTLWNEGQYLVTNRPSPRNFIISDQVPSENRLVYVGDIRKSRGIEEMLQIVSLNPEVTLDLIGPYNDDKNLMGVIEKYGVESRIKLHGRQPYETTWMLAKGAIAGLCFLHPTRAFCNVIPTKIWEYWSIGIPVLASDLPRQTELIRDANGGVTGTVAELSDTLKDWIQDPMKAEALGKSGFQYLTGQVDDSDQRLLEAVREVVNGIR